MHTYAHIVVCTREGAVPVRSWHRPSRQGRCLTSAPPLTCGNSAPRETRTPDPLVRSQVLYPLSYRRMHYIRSQMLYPLSYERRWTRLVYGTWGPGCGPT